MRAGQLRHQIQLQNGTSVQDSLGQSMPTFTTYATVWAKVEPLRGAEVERGKQIFAECDYKVTIRYRDGVKVTDRVVFGSQTFEIGSMVNWAMRNIMLELYCKEVN